MATWGDVDADFGGEETINFGPRVESGTALYQLETHATISPRGKVTEQPIVLACTAGEFVFVSGDRQLNVFKENCQKYLVTLDFPSKICAIGASDDGKYLSIGEQSGAVHIFDAITSLKLFSTTLENSDEGSEHAFVEITFGYVKQKKTWCVLVLTGVGQMHIFYLDLINLYDAAVAKDQERLKLLQSQIDHKIVDATHVHGDRVNYGIILPSSGDIITTGSGEASNLCLWKHENSRLVPYRTAVYSSEGFLGKCALSCCEQFLLVLNENGHLTLWSAVHFVIIWTSYTLSVKDFLIVNDASKNQSVHVMVLTTETDDSSQARIFALPSMECLYSVRLESFTALAQGSQTLETFYVIEGDFLENANVVSSLRVRSLMEALPESRLMRMLKKKQFKEAEEFAKQFDQDLESVYRAKSCNLLELLCQWNPEIHDEESLTLYIKDLKTCFDLITDDRFIVDCSIMAALPSLEMTLDLLKVAMVRVERKKTCGPEYCMYLERLNDTAHRLGTFQMMYGGGHYSSHRWEFFRNVEMQKELSDCLCNGRMHAVMTIWSRHRGDFQHLLTKDFLTKCLEHIPDEIPSTKLHVWLSKGLIPFAVQNLPEGLPFVAAWLEERAKNMEILERPGWPRNALEFCELLGVTFQTMSESMNQQNLLTPNLYAAQVCNLSVALSKMKAKDQSSKDDAFVRLGILTSQLRALCELHEQYNCRLTLSNFQLESVESIIYRMLDRVVAIELVPDAIHNTLRPYMKQYGLEEDRMLFQYVGDLSERCSKVVSCMGDAPWEAKAIQVIRCIKDPDYRCRALLNAMVSAYIPWSSDMETLVKETLAMDGCPRLKEVQEKCRMVELRKMLITYGLRNFRVAERNSAEMLAFHILSQDQPAAIQDALHVVSFYSHLDAMSIYLFRAKFLVEHRRMDELLQLFKSLEMSQSIHLGERFITYTQLVLSSYGQKLQKSLYSVACSNVIRLLLKINTGGEKDWQDRHRHILGIMENISSLQQEFEEYLSFNEYYSEDHRSKLLKQFVRNPSGIQNTERYRKREEEERKNKGDLRLDTERKSRKSHQDVESSCYRYAELLGIPREKVCLEIALIAITEGKIASAIKICRDLYDTVVDECAGPTLMRVAHSLCAVRQDVGLVEMVPNLAQEISDLARLALSAVSSDLLPDCLQLCWMTRIALALWDQCENGDYRNAIENNVTGSGDSQAVPYVSEVFVEDGIVLESSKILPIMFAIVFDCLPSLQLRGVNNFMPNRIQGSVEICPKKFESLFANVWKAMDYLQDNAQVELASGIAMGMVAVTIEFMGSHQTSDDRSKEQTSLHSILLKNVAMLINSVQEMLFGQLQKIFLCRSPDLQMAMSCVCSLPSQAVFDCLQKLVKKAGNQYKRIISISQTGLAFSRLVKERIIEKKCQEVAVDASWGYRLAKLRISFREAFLAPKEQKSRLLLVLVQNDLLSMCDLRDYCAAFKLKEDQEFLNCLSFLMIPMMKNDDGDVILCTMPVEKAIARAKGLCKQIKNTVALEQMLRNILMKLNPTDYERIEFVLKQLENLKPMPEIKRRLRLTACLKTYRSSITPGKRLPFHPLISGDHWKIITPELSAETVDDWLSMASILGVQMDMVLVTAIRNIIEKYVKDKTVLGVSNVTCCWREESLDMKLFETVQALLTRISSFELAISVAAWIIKELPPGADKVLVLKYCVDMAQIWHEKSTEGSADRDKAHKTWTEHAVMHRRLMTEQFLHINQLGEAELLALSHSPAKLIFKLYEHPCITNGKGLLTMESISPNIHAVVDQIAVINRVDVKRIRTVLVQQWLPSSLKRKQESADVTMIAGSGQDGLDFGEEKVDEDELNLFRVLYLLQCDPIKQTIWFLYNFAYSTNAAQITYLCRVRALRCLFALADMELIEPLMSFKTVSQIREDIKVFLYLAELERLGIPQTVEVFEKLNKEGLVRTIWRNHNHDFAAVSLASNLCLDYTIKDEQLWSRIIQKLLAFRSFDHLCNVLERLSEESDVWHLSFVETAICGLLSSMLGSLSAPIADDKISSCLHLFAIVCRCPAALTVKTINGWLEEFKRLGLLTCAFGCALLLPPDDENSNQLSALLDPNLISCVLKQLDSWTNVKHGIPLSDLIIEFIKCRNGDRRSLEDKTFVKTEMANLAVEDCESTVFE